MSNASAYYAQNEQALLFSEGDEQALAFFFREFHAALALYAFKWIKDRSIAEEIASDAFVKIWKQHHKLDNYYAIRAYLYKIVQRDSQRVCQKELRRSTFIKGALLSDVNDDTPIDHLLRTETYRIIHTVLKELSPGARRVLTMYYLEGKSTGEIAQELNLSPSTIKTQKSKGLEALRRKLLTNRFKLIVAIIINGLFLIMWNK